MAGATVVVVGAAVVVVVEAGSRVVVVAAFPVGQSQRCPPWFQAKPEAQFCSTGFPLMTSSSITQK
jgi:hypothetical protein